MERELRQTILKVQLLELKKVVRLALNMIKILCLLSIALKQERRTRDYAPKLKVQSYTPIAQSIGRNKVLLHLVKCLPVHIRQNQCMAAGIQ